MKTKKIPLTPERVNRAVLTFITPSGEVRGEVVARLSGKVVVKAYDAPAGTPFAVRTETPEKVAYFADLDGAEKYLRKRYGEQKEEVFDAKPKEYKRITRAEAEEAFWGTTRADDGWNMYEN